MMPRYQLHEFAALLPSMGDAEYEAFRDDIRRNGLRDPITLFEGKILDGRHRQRACDETGVKPRYIKFAGDRMEAIRFVVSANLQRRHLSQSQRAILAPVIEVSISQEVRRQRIAKISAAAKSRSQKPAKTSDGAVDTTQGETSVNSRSSRIRACGIAGLMLGVGESQVLTAKKLWTFATKHPTAESVAFAVRDGKVSLSAGAALARKLQNKEVTDPQARAILASAINEPSATKAGYSIINGIRNIKNARREKLQSIEINDRQVVLHPGRFQDIRLDPGSVDWIITDPPYGTKYVPMYAELSEWAARVLRPGGSAFIMIGQGALDRTLPALCQSLTYLWTLGYVLEPGSTFTQIPSLYLVSGWKPVIWLCNGPRPNHQFSNPDTYVSKIGERDKTGHAWQQGQGFFDMLVSKFTLNTQIVCDPFLGTGTTGVSCKKFGRHFIGIEADSERFEASAARINATATLTVAG